MNCNKCNKWVGAHATLPGQSTEHLCMCPPQTEQEPVAQPRFNCWSTNDGDSWFEHPADADVIYNTLGDEPKVGDEFEIIAGWRSVAAKYRVTEVNGDGDCEVECISHPQENTTPPQRKPLTDECERDCCGNTFKKVSEVCSRICPNGIKPK